jgi:(p)ppGpp synthase/HD superfamily hydrolase
MLLTERFSQALQFAAELHATQVRKASAVPYIAHLLAVASIVLEYRADEDTAIAALLHDAIEDQGGAATRDEIRRRFGDRVVAIVDGCTDCETVPKPPWRPRKETYIAHLACTSPEVRLVALADKLHNARSVLKDYRALGEELWKRFSGGREGTLWYYRAVVEAVRGQEPAQLVEELDRVVTEIERLAAKKSLPPCHPKRSEGSA